MARRYDSSTTTFSPEGRLHQVEYAIEAINNAGTCVGILAKNGVVMASEKRVTTALLAPSKTSEKTYKLANHAACNVAGLAADANILIDQARLNAGRYTYAYCQPIPIEQLVEHVCNYKQAYTQYGGLRPFGVAFLFAGYDTTHGFQLYQSDPSGNYSGWKATVIGANNQSGKSLLKNEYGTKVDADGEKKEEGEEGKEEEMKTTEEEDDNDQDTVSLPSVKEALCLAVKVLNKTMDANANSPEKMELFQMTLDETKKEGKNVLHKILSKDETQEIIDIVESETVASGDM